MLARESTNRYSVLGLMSVGTLMISGLLNSCLLVPNLEGLVASPYGAILCIKLGLFGILVSIAAINRQRIRPMLLYTDCEAPGGVYRRGVERLCGNAMLETCLGILILLAVGLLTTTPPPIYMMP
jgi:copper resistance protein D